MTARQAAVICLLEVENGGYSNLSLDRILSSNKVRGGDGDFLSALFYLTLERQITLDYIIDKYLLNPGKKLDIEVRVILRTGLCQILYMNGVPDFAAVDESVKLCSHMKIKSAGTLVNAVLRKALAYGSETLADKINETGMYSIIYSVNEPLCRLLNMQYGSRVQDILKGFFTRGKQALRVNTLKTDARSVLERFQKDGISAETGPLEASVYIKDGKPQTSAVFKEGLIRPQSICSQTAVAALAPREGDRVIDMCCAPGGKSLTAAQLMKNKGEIIAIDRHANRLKLVDERAKAEGISIIKTINADSSVPDTGLLNSADRVIVDVPCSGFGEIYSKPELRHKLPASDNGLPEIQHRILTNAADYLKVKGRLVYSTCTLDKRENHEVVKRFLDSSKEYIPVSDMVFQGFEPDENGFLTHLPSEADGEGFFIAAFEKAER